MMAKTAKDSAEHIVKILRDKGVKRNQDGQMSWLIEFGENWLQEPRIAR